MSTKRLGPELNQDLAFQYRTWRMQRAGWGVIALILFLALLGLFGHGLLSRATIRDPSLPISLTYERLERYQGISTLRVHLDRGFSRQETVRIWLSKDYVNRIEIQQITPKPERAETSATGMIYVFRLAMPEEGADILIHVQMHAIGLVRGRLGLDESQALDFWQWIYP